MTLLSVRELSVAYGGSTVLFDCTLDVPRGQIVAILGANGAGKSTLLRAVSGLVAPKSGTVFFDGQDLATVTDHGRVALGISHVPEGRKVFATLSVLDNLRLGGHLVRRNGDELRNRLERAFAHFPILRERQDQVAFTLSGGEQQMLAIARGLMAQPKLLMIDEASLGLAPATLDELFRVIQELRTDGITLLVVEQNAAMSLGIADRAYVLEKGRVVFSGAAREMMRDRRLSEAYLGGELSAGVAPSPGRSPKSEPSSARRRRGASKRSGAR